MPPVRREEGEGASREGGGVGGGLVDAVRNRVQYGGPSSDGARVPLELEGDERLRNIEPRMVELIMNEVCTLCCWSE